MMLDREKKYVFSIKFGRSEITVPYELVLAIFGGLFSLSFLKIIRSL
jgi:hypothetical protein